MTIDQLTMFIAVADTGTFSAAAKQLRISQPAISVAIKSLEDELNLQLLDRSGYRPRLTASGEEIYRHAKRLLNLKAEITATAAHLASGEEKRLKIILDTVAPLPHILGLVRRYFASERACKIELSFCVLGGGLDDVIKNNADLYIGPVFAELEQHPLLFHSRYHMIPVLGRAHPDSALPLLEIGERIAQIPRVLLREGKDAGPVISPGDSANEHETIFVEDYLIKRETILAGLGWGRLPLWNIEHELNLGLLIDIRSLFPRMQITGDIYAVPKTHRHGKHLSALLALLETKR